MVELLRVDHRLLHGQIVYSWVAHLEADCILIANDDVLNNEIRRSIIKLAKPQGIKLVIKGIDDSIQAINSGITDKYKLLIIVESTDDAIRLIESCKQIKKLNLGNIKARENAKKIGLLFNVTYAEELKLRELVEKGIEIGIQRVPEDNFVPLIHAL